MSCGHKGQSRHVLGVGGRECLRILMTSPFTVSYRRARVSLVSSGRGGRANRRDDHICPKCSEVLVEFSQIRLVTCVPLAASRGEEAAIERLHEVIFYAEARSFGLESLKLARCCCPMSKLELESRFTCAMCMCGYSVVLLDLNARPSIPVCVCAR